MNRLGPFCLALALVAFTSWMAPAAAWGQARDGAILLLPESDLDQELAEDLTEVLIASFLGKGGKEYRIIGKELFRKSVSEARLEGVASCAAGFELECYRQAGKDRGLSVVVVGRVGKAMGGFRLEVFRLSTSGLLDKSQRKRVPGELEQLIAEVEGLAEWILQPENPLLRVTVSEPGSEVSVDGQPYTNPADPLRVLPGIHKVEAKKRGFADASVEVSCEPDAYCLAALTLTKAEEPVVVPEVVEGPPKTAGEPRNPHRFLPWAIASGSVALLSGLGAGYFYLNMGSYKDDIEAIKSEYCPGNACSLTRAQFKGMVDPLVEDGNNSAIGATALGVVALVGAVAGGVLLVLDLTDSAVVEEDRSGSLTLLPVAGPDGVGFNFDFTF